MKASTDVPVLMADMHCDQALTTVLEGFQAGAGNDYSCETFFC